MAYLAYHFNVIPHQPGSEILIALIADFGFDTFDYSDVGFIAYINEELSTNLNFTDLKFDDFIYSYQIEKIKTINWNAEWEQNFDPVLVDDLLFIRAPFHEKNLSFKHEIVIMPKMSFGTGHHQTTRLVCKEMFSVDFLINVYWILGAEQEYWQFYQKNLALMKLLVSILMNGVSKIVSKIVQ